jgi:hypothetical protein
MAARRWTLEQKLRQSEVIRRWKPWEKSTGAKTAKGKAIVSKNALKYGESQELRILSKVINILLMKSIKYKREVLG